MAIRMNDEEIILINVKLLITEVLLLIEPFITKAIHL